MSSLFDRPAASLAAIATVVALGTLSAPAMAQSGTLRGRIVDVDSRQPIEGATIAVDGGSGTARSTADGAWRVSVSATGGRRVVVRRVGYAEERLTLVPGVDTAAVIALSANVHSLDATVVTAARREQKLKDVAVTTEVVNRQEIEQTGSSNIASVLTEQTGIQFSGGHPSGSGVALEGMSDQRVLILVDGVPLYGRISGGNDLTRIPTSAVERVEIVKGPQSTLYGSEAMGGVVNIITRGANAPSSNLELRAIGGSDHRTDTDLYGTLRTGDLALAADLGHRYVERTPGIAGTAGALVDRVDGLTTARWAPAGPFALDATALVLNERQRWLSGGLYDFADNTQFNGRVGSTWTTDARRFATTLSFSQLDHLSRASQFDEPIAGTGDRQKQRLGQADLLYTQHIASATLDVGTQLRQEYISSTDGRIAGGSRTLSSAEPYVQAEFASARWSVVPGARLSWNEQWGAYASPRVAVRFRADSSLTFRGSLGRGFRAPDFKELYLDFTNDAAFYSVKGNGDLKPEHSDNASLGADWNRGIVYARGQVYWNELHDFIETRPLASTGQFAQYTYGNIDRSTTRGAEAEWGLSLGSVRAEAGYAYLYARDKSTDGALLGQPAQSARALLGGTLPFALRTTATVTYTGRTPMARADDGTITSNRDAYTRLDLRVARRLLDRADLSVGADNLFDTQPALWADAVRRQFYAGVTWRLRADGVRGGIR